MYGLRAGRKPPTGDNKRPSGWKYYFFFSRCIFYRISLILFYERVLFSLRNTRTKFRVAVLSRCGDMLKLGGNISIISFPSEVFNRFFFFYERVLFSLQNSRSKFCLAVLTQCGAILKLGGNTTISFLCAFFIGFL